MHLPPSTSGQPAALRGLRRWPRLIAAVLTSTLAWPCLAACDLSTPKGLYQFLEHSDEEGRRLKARGTLAFDGAGALLIRGEVLSGKRAGPMHRVREYKVSRDCVISVEESGSFSWDLDIEGGNLTWYVQVKNEIFNGKAHRVGNLAPNVDREIRQAVQERVESIRLGTETMRMASYFSLHCIPGDSYSTACVKFRANKDELIRRCVTEGDPYCSYVASIENERTWRLINP